MPDEAREVLRCGRQIDRICLTLDESQTYSGDAKELLLTTLTQAVGLAD